MPNHDFEIKPSKQYLLLMMGLIVMSIAMVLLTPLLLVMKLVCILFILWYGGYVIWRDGLLRSQYSVRHLRRLVNGKWQLQGREVLVAELMPDSTVTHWVMVLRFRLPGCFWIRSAILFRDSLSADAYRRLLVMLRMY